MADEGDEIEELDEDTRLVVYEIHGDVKRIQQHLDELNGAVARHEKDINKIQSKISDNSKRINYGVGAMFLVSLLVSVAAAVLSSGVLK